MIRAVLDVNVLVSALLAPRGAPRQVLTLWQEQQFSSITSEGMIIEVEAKLRRPDIGGAYGVTGEDIQWVEALLRTQSEVVVVSPQAVVSVTGDPEDDYVLATTIIGQAQYLVTGDKKLQQLGTYHEVKIISPRAFLEIITE